MGGWNSFLPTTGPQGSAVALRGRRSTPGAGFDSGAASTAPRSRQTADTRMFLDDLRFPIIRHKQRADATIMRPPVAQAEGFGKPVVYRIRGCRLSKTTAFSRQKRQSLKTTCKNGRKV